MGILALIAEFENDIRRERQMDGIKKARERGTRFGRKPVLVTETIQQSEEAKELWQNSARDHAPDLSIQGVSVPGSCRRISRKHTDGYARISRGDGRALHRQLSWLIQRLAHRGDPG
jgi:hypothetical protein